MQIINLSTDAILMIAEAATRANAEGRRFRLAFNPGYDPKAEIPIRPASVSYKVGEGMWSAPLYDQIDDDPYRD